MPVRRVRGAISTASASLMTEMLKGKTEAESEALFEKFHDLVTGKSMRIPRASASWLFSRRARVSCRVKCAVLAWHTLRAALQGSLERVATE